MLLIAMLSAGAVVCLSGAFGVVISDRAPYPAIHPPPRLRDRTKRPYSTVKSKGYNIAFLALREV
jgi:hypothetical protein